jgi:hypothetical protein
MQALEEFESACLRSPPLHSASSVGGLKRTAVRLSALTDEALEEFERACLRSPPAVRLRAPTDDAPAAPAGAPPPVAEQQVEEEEAEEEEGASRKRGPSWEARKPLPPREVSKQLTWHVSHAERAVAAADYEAEAEKLKQQYTMKHQEQLEKTAQQRLKVLTGLAVQVQT